MRYAILPILLAASCLRAATPAITLTQTLNFETPDQAKTALSLLSDSSAEPSLLEDGSLAVFAADDHKLLASWRESDKTLRLARANLTFSPATAGINAFILPAGTTVAFGQVAIAVPKNNKITPIIRGLGNLTFIADPGGLLSIQAAKNVACGCVSVAGNLTFDLNGDAEGGCGRIEMGIVNNQGTGLNASGIVTLSGGEALFQIWERTIIATRTVINNCRVQSLQPYGNQVHFQMIIGHFEMSGADASFEAYSYCQGSPKLFTSGATVTIPDTHYIASGGSATDSAMAYLTAVDTNAKGKRYIKVAPAIARNESTKVNYPTLKVALRANTANAPIRLLAHTDEALTIATSIELIDAKIYAPNVVRSDTPAVCRASGLWSNPAVWEGEKLPQDGGQVIVDGAGTVLDLDTQLPWLSELIVTNGAILRIRATQNETLPPIKVAWDSTLEVGNGTEKITVVAQDGLLRFGAKEAQDGSVHLSTFLLHTNATISGMINWKNVDLKLYGTFWKPSADIQKAVFGTADAGETTWIGLHIDTPMNLRAGCTLAIATPAAGGCVKPIGTIRIDNFNANFNSKEDYGNYFHFGKGNPETVPIQIIARNSNFRYGLNLENLVYLGGRTTLVLTDNSYLGAFPLSKGGPNNLRQDYWPGDGDTAYFTKQSVHILDSAQIILDNATLNSGRISSPGERLNGWNLSPTEENHPSIVVRRGCYRVWACSSKSNGKARLKVDGECRIDLVSGVQGGVEPRPLDGFGGVDLAEGSKLTFSILSHSNRLMRIGCGLTGSGEVSAVGTNATVIPVKVCFAGDSSNYSGAMSVDTSAGPAKFYFADGAVWGSVAKASLCALTNLVDAAAVCTVSFGGLELDGEGLSLRVKGDRSCDRLELGAAGFSGTGGLRIVWPDGQISPSGSEPVVATRPKDSATRVPPVVSEGGGAWRLSVRDSQTDSREELRLVPAGTLLIFY
ncbi:MAG: hypothetical protein SPK06_00875 [Kiritimatiellia bacterium]|nr:hypothetical protein [Kiritimatiellia bacterium]